MSLKFKVPGLLLVFVGFIGLIKWIIPMQLHASDALLAAFNLCFFVSLGLLINKGYRLTKFIVLAFAVMGLITFPGINNLSNVTTTISLTHILQRVLLIAATIILFKPVKIKDEAETSDGD
jgi:hypothetical protein